MPSSPLPQGTRLPEGNLLGRVIRSVDEAFWIHAVGGGRRVLVMTPAFASAVSLEPVQLKDLTFAGISYRYHLGSGALDSGTAGYGMADGLCAGAGYGVGVVVSGLTNG